MPSSETAPACLLEGCCCKEVPANLLEVCLKLALQGLALEARVMLVADIQSCYTTQRFGPPSTSNRQSCATELFGREPVECSTDIYGTGQPFVHGMRVQVTQPLAGALSCLGVHDWLAYLAAGLNAVPSSFQCPCACVFVRVHAQTYPAPALQLQLALCGCSIEWLVKTEDLFRLFLSNEL
eukprot:scaffold121582_cov23-Tisochrysis_lutea.AAC.2